MTSIRQKGDIHIPIKKFTGVEKKIDVIVVSVNYNDFLSITLEQNIKIFDNITVVTYESDEICKKLCDKFGAKCIQTNIMYENGDNFNKGKAINLGIKSIENPELILLLDADCIVGNNIDTCKLDKDILYTSGRIIIESNEQYERWKEDEKSKVRVESNRGLGFFHLFDINSRNINKNCPYPDNYPNADGSDLVFRNLFNRREDINNKVIHLGVAYKNWRGRKSENFITIEKVYEVVGMNISENVDIRVEKEEFNINSYFDKIYCLNLDRNENRWMKVNPQFESRNILVTRWSAIDGDNIPDSFFKEFISVNLKEIQSSKLGILENKYALACLLSHISIINDAKINNYKKILIFEDDVVLSDDFSKKLQNINQLDWKILYLGSTQLHQRGIEFVDNFYKCRNTLGTFAYALDESILGTILTRIIENEKSIDNLLSDVQSENYGKCYCFNPNIVIVDKTEKSEIRNKNLNQKVTEKSWDVTTKLYKKSLKFNKKRAILNLLEIKAILEKYKVNYWLTDGTLLGMFRQKDFISHDLDTDIGIDKKRFNPIVIEKLLQSGFKLDKNYGLIDLGFEFSLIKEGVKTDFFFFYEEVDKIWHAAWFSNDDKNFELIKYSYDKFSISQNYFFGIKFNTPSNVENYIIQKYGLDWNIPKSDWDWKFSPSNHQRTEISIKKAEMDRDFMKILSTSNLNEKLTLVIKSFKRNNCLNNLLESIRSRYEFIKIIIVDDSDEDIQIKIDNFTEFYKIDFDSGLSKGRNYAISKVDTKYFILLDDDFEFTKKTDLEKWLIIIENSDLDILGGDVFMNGVAMEYNGCYKFDSETRTLEYSKNYIQKFSSYTTYDFILNFFIAKTESIRNNPWDDELKLAEHTAFFFDNKGKIKVGYTNLISINHQKVLEGDYVKFRKRGTSYFNLWMKKKNIIKTINLKGEEHTCK